MDEATLRLVTSEADTEMADARAKLVRAVRQASAAGMSQRQIAAASGRSQPEISRLLRFHGSTPRARDLRRWREKLIDELAKHGVHNVRVFGSLARGDDGEESDIDLLVNAERPIGLLAQERLRADISHIVGHQVDLVFDDAIRHDLRDRILEEAVPL